MRVTITPHGGAPLRAHRFARAHGLLCLSELSRYALSSHALAPTVPSDVESLLVDVQLVLLQDIHATELGGGDA